MKKLVYGLLSVTVLGCSATYKSPTTSYQPTILSGNFNIESALQSATQKLSLDGYQIQYADKDSGVISTSPKVMKLTPEQADCGTSMGIDYLKDKRTKTSTAVNLVITSTQITISTTINGEYKPGDVSQDITLSCVSRGSIESDIASMLEI